MQFPRILCAITFILASSVLATAQSSQAISATAANLAFTAALITFPAGSNNQPQALVRAGNHGWQNAKFMTRDGKYIFHLSPAELGGSEMLLLINPPADLDITDVVPPAITGLKIDGKAYPAHPSIHLGALQKAPRTVLVGIADASNALDIQAIKIFFNGNKVRDEAVSIVTSGNRKATISVDLGEVDYGSHSAVISVPDASPQHNVRNVTIAFDRLATTNFLSAHVYDVTLKTDSAFSGYESLTSLTDGFINLSGGSCQNDVSWASAEQPEDHWVDVTMDQPRTISEVTLYWAKLGAVYHTSQKILIQIPDGDGWKTIYSSPSGGMKEQKCTTLAFEPVKTQRFRIFQPAGGGAPSRTNLMWLAEVEAR